MKASNLSRATFTLEIHVARPYLVHDSILLFSATQYFFLLFVTVCCGNFSFGAKGTGGGGA
jgi:hypothetical protein